MVETVLDYISRTNFFNFLIFATLLILVYVKLNVSGKLGDGVEYVAEEIEDSKTAKEEAETNLKATQEKIAHLSEEIDVIVHQSEENAKLVGEKIITDANEAAVNIGKNAEKAVENRAALLKNDILKRASLATVEIAKNQIINELNNNYDLHNKLIDESVEAINGADI